MSLRERLPKHDTVGEFELARADRLEDALVLAAGGRRMGAIYVLGYFVEITLKSAFFQYFGFSEDDAIRPIDLRAAAQIAKTDLQVETDPVSYHSPVFWGRACIAIREKLGVPWPRSLRLELENRIQRLNSNWSVSMRYSRDVSSSDDWVPLLDDALWLHGTLTIDNNSMAS